MSLPPLDSHPVQSSYGIRDASGPALGLRSGLPRHVLSARHGEGRPWGSAAGRPRPPGHSWVPLRQGRPIPGAGILADASAASAPPHRPQRRRQVRTDRLGGGAGRDRLPAARGAGRVGAGGDPALQLLRHDGPGAGRLDGPAFLPPPRRFPPAAHDLLRGRHDGARSHLRMPARHGSRTVPAREADHRVGGEHPGDQRPSMAFHRRGPAQRGSFLHHRSRSQPHR